MIGTEDMSAAAGMDISESFRAEDLSKADFFDFVTGPDMGIGIGVGVGVEALGVSLHQQQQHHQNHQQSPHSHNNNHIQVVHQPITSQSQQQSLCGGARTNSSMIHDGGGGGAGGGGGVVVPVGNRNGTTNGGDPTLQGYEFWHQDKDSSRLDSSSIFEDLDRYCWQQQPVTASASNGGSASTNQPSPTSPQGHLQQQQQQQQQHQQHQQQQQHQQLQQQQQQPNASSSSAASSGAGSSSDTISSLDTTDGQIYTLTVLNGGEPWLKRSEAEQLPTSLDLDSLLGSFPGYIKSEYPYDDSGFSTDGKDVIGNGTDGLSSISQAQNQQGQQTQQTLPSLVTAISLAGGNDLGQQLAQFQNNNNDWHMADHNTETEQSTAESLLRSALQGKGYAKGLHMQNGLTMPVVKDEDMRRLLFADEAAALGFADSTLSAAQMFDEAQGIHLSSQQQQQQQQQHNGNANILVDDMFLSLENAFSDDFEKIKRIANEVQQFCSAGSAGTPTPGDYGPPSDVLMQISPSTAVTTAGQLQPPQPLKPEVSTSTSPASAVVVSAASSHVRSGAGGGVTKPKKAYKRSSSNNNNPNVANNNQSSGTNPLIGGSGSGSSSSGSASSSSNSPPANSGGSSSSSSGSAQRKERSLHYCSICSKGFKDKYSVNVHIRTHTGEKPFACSLCGKSFRQKAHLAKHYQTHMTQKNNGNLIKGGSGKHPRSSGSTGGSASASLNQRQPQITGGGVVPSSLPVMISNPNTPPGGVLPPANGLLTNR
ncbi:zinc finger protein 853 [Drosophila subpulchrella]|uniref:zinc finger protein 853 n=1 Tax=Drosophila subpulchrella TaxID=1486046 RepID=UPI0018A156ED|nr:zinc finger protein 853 [Drosophila subpulchrella]XP_037732566.1 zinc finger protein 853 [Drosophila subpulchrella]